MLFLLAHGVAALNTWTTLPRSAAVAPRTAVRMFDEQKPVSDPFPSPVTVTRSREAGGTRTGSIVVTNGADSFYQSRTCLQALFDFGGFSKIVAVSEDVPAAKKTLLSRNARYSGLLDALDFQDQADGFGFEGASVWLALHADEAALGAQVEAAAAAGVKRAFILFSADGPTLVPSGTAALEAKMAAAGISYTMMRTGSLVSGVASGSGLALDDIDVPVCEDMPQEDVYRFVTEALTLDGASNRAFSLCPSAAVGEAFKQMRLCGYERRDEVGLLLSGDLNELAVRTETVDAEPKEESAEEATARLESEAEVAAAREEELKALLAKARQRGAEVQKKLKEDAEKQAAIKQAWKERAEGKGPDAGAGAVVEALEATLAATTTDAPDEKPKADEDDSKKA